MPKTEIQNSQIKDRRRNDMIVAATKIFSFTNYRDVTIDQIANQLNCSHGLFYHYFKSKHDIFCAVMDKALSEASSLLEVHKISHYRPMEAIKHFVKILLDTMANGTEYDNSVLYLIFNLRLQSTNFKDEEFLKKCFAATNKLHLLIQQAQEEGTAHPGDPKHYTMCLVALMKGLLFNRLYVGRDKFKCPSVSTVMHLMEVSK